MGGKTIQEAKEQLSVREFRQWVAYRNKRGSLNVGLRAEFAAAQIAMILANVNSKKGGFSVYDFAPFHDKPEEAPVTLEAAMKDWK